MSWKQIGINLLIMVVVYLFVYSTSYFFSKRWVKRKENKDNKKSKWSYISFVFFDSFVKMWYNMCTNWGVIIY